MPGQPDEREPQEQPPPPTPFDHPLFLPVVFVLMALWFGYDGFLTDDPKMLEHLAFNRIGFALVCVGALWFGYKGIKEWQQTRREREDFDPDRDPGSGGRPPPIA